MSQQGTNLPQDVDGSSPGGAGSAGTAGSGSGSVSSSTKLAAEITSAGFKPASPAINPTEDVQEAHDGATSLGEAMPASVGLAVTAGSSSVMLAGEDSNGGSKPISPLAVHSVEKNAGSNPASPVVVHAGWDNNGGSKPASPAAEVGAGDSDKGEGKNELAGGEGGGDDAAGDSGGFVGSNSKSIRRSSDGEVQDDVEDAPKPAAGGGCCGGGGKGKGKGAAAEADNALHIWTERERRKKMKSMYSTLHSLLPRLPNKADKATIVGEAVDYIKTLEDTIKKLEKLKVDMERMRAQQLGAGSSAAPAAPPACHGREPAPATWESALADMVQNWNAQQQAAAAVARAPALGPFQSWSAPNIAVSVTGNEAFISVCVPRQRSVLTMALCVLEKYRIDAVTTSISSDQNQSLFSIHARINAASARLSERLITAEDWFKLAVSEMLMWIVM